ncbi:hypothetical protein PoB_005760000 [Plakobranchus ocellatus]|uniref:Uncharacterized protein n=1 Tax=Plakobranchus ocellatus TaxID=259542 RepID=A0AAV4CHR7_9GAST|nr:hypothetical protein PoB_005760000 [Plakobranchus ocellatus]
MTHESHKKIFPSRAQVTDHRSKKGLWCDLLFIYIGYQANVYAPFPVTDHGLPERPMHGLICRSEKRNRTGNTKASPSSTDGCFGAVQQALACHSGDGCECISHSLEPHGNLLQARFDLKHLKRATTYRS